uniref:Uncharacterized protein n=1 Tax=Meloidogyne enterolobii TaxID=390850 RepID=A0A6V7VAZ7_MELEN|nr:unnamed protein product [Meloidogyne enterolobii]
MDIYVDWWWWISYVDINRRLWRCVLIRIVFESNEKIVVDCTITQGEFQKFFEGKIVGVDSSCLNVKLERLCIIK